METVAVETWDRVNEAGGGGWGGWSRGDGMVGGEKTLGVIYLPNQGPMSGLWPA